MLKKLVYSWILGLMLVGGFMGCNDPAADVPDTDSADTDPTAEEAPPMDPKDIPPE